MGWLTLLKTLLSLADTLAGHLRERNLMDAGEAKNVARAVMEAQASVDRARAARAAVRDDPDSLRNDPENRDD